MARPETLIHYADSSLDLGREARISILYLCFGMTIRPMDHKSKRRNRSYRTLRRNQSLSHRDSFWPVSRNQPPVQAKTSPVPAHHGFGGHDDEGLLSARPDSPSKYPEEPVERAQARSRTASLQPSPLTKLEPKPCNACTTHMNRRASATVYLADREVRGWSFRSTLGRYSPVVCWKACSGKLLVPQVLRPSVNSAQRRNWARLD